jgi:hypothetical protein
MRIDLGSIPADCERWLPRNEPDASGVGVNYADAFLKVFKRTLEDGTKVSCRRRGLEITLKIGGSSGRALLRRLAHGPDVRDILHAALTDAAAQAGAVYGVDDGVVFLEI